MEEQIDAFVQHMATERQYAPNTLAAYRGDLLQFHHFILLERPHLSSWARVDALLMQAFLLHLKARSYSPASIARKIAAVKSFYFFLLEKKEIVGNPALGLEVPQVVKHAPRPLTEEEVSKLLEAVSEATPKGYRDRAILELMYTAGLRATELVTLPLEAVDFEKQSVQVEGADGVRVVELSERALAAVRTYLEMGRPALNAPLGSGPFFVNPRGRQMTRQGMWLIIKGYAKQAGIGGAISANTFRHTFAARRLAQGESMQGLQRLLGHAHLSTTLGFNRRSEAKA